MSTTSLVQSCAATTCAFNNDGCTALAINVAGSAAATCIVRMTSQIEVMPRSK